MSLLVYLPATFGHRFTPHLARIIPPILKGLADAEESVRSAAMKAGRMIVSNYSSKAIDLLLPELERGMFDSGWRIRVRHIPLLTESMSNSAHSTHLSPSLESYCSAYLVSAERPKSKKTKKPLSTLPQPKVHAAHSPRRLERNAGTVCSQLCILFVKTRLQLFVLHLSISGRLLWPIPQGPVSQVAYMRVSSNPIPHN